MLFFWAWHYYHDIIETIGWRASLDCHSLLKQSLSWYLIRLHIDRAYLYLYPKIPHITRHHIYSQQRHINNAFTMLSKNMEYINIFLLIFSVIYIISHYLHLVRTRASLLFELLWRWGDFFSTSISFDEWAYFYWCLWRVEFIASYIIFMLATAASLISLVIDWCCYHFAASPISPRRASCQPKFHICWLQQYISFHFIVISELMTPGSPLSLRGARFLAAFVIIVSRAGIYGIIWYFNRLMILLFLWFDTPQMRTSCSLRHAGSRRRLSILISVDAILFILTSHLRRLVGASLQKENSFIDYWYSGRYPYG